MYLDRLEAEYQTELCTQTDFKQNTRQNYELRQT